MNYIYRGTKEFDGLIGRELLTIVDAMKQIDIVGFGVLFIEDGDSRLAGCLTDGDIRRYLINGGDINAGIVEVITKEPKYLRFNEDIHFETYMAEKGIRALPILNEEGTIIEIIVNGSYQNMSRSNDSLADIPIVIMAGGKGKRLYPYTEVLPKPLIPIGDYPIIEHIMRRFLLFGAKKFYVIVNYKKNIIKAYFNDIESKYDITFVDEMKELGTGGGLSLLRSTLSNRTFVLSNCDILVEADFSKVLNYHLERKNAITIISSLNKFIIPYGVIDIDKSGIVTSMTEKPELSYLTNTGCYFVDGSVVNNVKDDERIDFPDLIEICIKKELIVGTYPVSENAWMDMGEYDKLENMRERLGRERQYAI